jgi:hypothetical protein
MLGKTATRLAAGLRRQRALIGAVWLGALIQGALFLVPATQAHAQGFAAYISPPRFEVQIKAGQPLREVIDIQHAGAQSGRYRVYTNDWTYLPDNTAAFSDALAPDSCRPWVALERRELTIAPGARFRFRFEITPPPDTPPRECRFAIMVEGMDPTAVANSNFNFPVGGRIAVIVYAGIGGAEPKLEIVSSRVALVNGQQLPVLEVRNSGNAHGRLDGFLTGKDKTGAEFEMAPADSPILPGDTRLIGLSPVVAEGKANPPIQYPLKVTGTLEWGKVRLPLEQTFAP